jgi:hypothetical protein
MTLRSAADGKRSIDSAPPEKSGGFKRNLIRIDVEYSDIIGNGRLVVRSKKRDIPLFHEG